jgi:hypothetical protein
MLIPADHTIESVTLAQKAVLVVEKHTVFTSLINDKFQESFPNVLLVTGRGFPDVATRSLLNRLSKASIDGDGTVTVVHDDIVRELLDSMQDVDEITSFQQVEDFASGQETGYTLDDDTEMMNLDDIEWKSAAGSEGSIIANLDWKVENESTLSGSELSLDWQSESDTEDLHMISAHTSEFQDHSPMTNFTFNESPHLSQDLSTRSDSQTYVSSPDKLKLMLLVDCDPAGIEIYLTYTVGSKVRSLTPELGVPVQSDISTYLDWCMAFDMSWS